MPLYMLTSKRTISSTNKQKLVDLVVDAHCNIMVAPEQFVHVAFSDGVPIANKNELYIQATVRVGREKNQVIRLKQALQDSAAKILQVRENRIYVNLLEIQSNWVMEGGHVMPAPGEEDEWMERVTKALAAEKKAE